MNHGMRARYKAAARAAGGAGMAMLAACIAWAAPEAAEVERAAAGLRPYAPQAPAGERYRAVVPDTLDLAERCELALNGLTGSVDPEHRHVQYFMTRFAADPPYLIHMDYGDIICTAKWLESLPLLRAATGSELNLDVEAKMVTDLLERVGTDGLIYIGKEEIANTGWLSKRGDYPIAREDLSSVIHDGRAMLAMFAYQQADGRGEWRTLIEAMSASLARIAILKKDYMYYPEGRVGMEFSILKESGWANTDEPKGETEGAEGSVLCYQGSQLRAMARAYELTKDPALLEACRRLARFIMLPKFWPAPGEADRIAGAERGHFVHDHLHARYIATRGLIELARVSGDQQILGFVRDSYEYSRAFGIPAIGMFGQSVGGIDGTVEGCTLADMVAMAISLSDLGAGDYWDDADRVIRNQLAEQQFTDAKRLEAVARAAATRDEAFIEEDKRAASWGEKFYTDLLTRSRPDARDAIQRSLGLFAGASFATAIAHPVQLGCCSGNATNALYYAWEAIARGDEESAQVNLLLNRASPWVDIESHLPYEGKVVLRNKTAKRLSVRLPQWVELKEARLEVNGENAPTQFVGRYLTAGGLKPGDALTITFPNREYTLRQTLPHDREYRIRFKGSTVTDIEPRPAFRVAYPIYQREQYKAEHAPTKEVTRFVAKKRPTW